MIVGETKRNIYDALNNLMEACGLRGESGTETLFDLLSQAVVGVTTNGGL